MYDYIQACPGARTSAKRELGALGSGRFASQYERIRTGLPSTGGSRFLRYFPHGLGTGSTLPEQHRSEMPPIAGYLPLVGFRLILFVSFDCLDQQC
jgi:hypothetical protein